MNLHHRSLNQTQHCFASVFPSIHWFVAFFSQEDMVLQCVIYRHPAASDTYSVKISPGSCLISYAAHGHGGEDTEISGQVLSE